MGTPQWSQPAAYLKANNEAYGWLVNKIRSLDRRKRPEVVLGKVEKAAQFAVEFHTGRFADGAIENLLLEIGAELDSATLRPGSFPLPGLQKLSPRRVLHVVTRVVGIGGHTRMLYHWVRNDQSSCHSLVVVNQSNVPIPPWLCEAIRISDGTIIAFPPELHLLQKARWLREIARQGMELAVLHHFGSDVVPTIAFAVHDCPPVAVLNHADHLFWVGSSVADIVIDLRTAGSEYTAERRFVLRNHVIPVPLSDPAVRVSRWDARRALGIGEDQVVLLSVGRAEKYQPCGLYDFVATVNKILERQPDAHLYVVGESLAGIAPYLREAPHERLHFRGSMDDPSFYRAAADVYLESFPFGSQTALLEAALSGLPVVPAYAPLFPLLVANDDALADILCNPVDEQEYITRAEQLISEPKQRVAFGEVLRKRLLVDHLGEGWLDRLAAMYQETDRLTHDPRPIPTSPCNITEADINLSLWHVMAGRTFMPGTTDDANAEQAIRCHTAFVAKTVGDYATARHYALRAVRRDPCRLSLWRLLAIALLSKTGSFVRRLFLRGRTLSMIRWRWRRKAA